MAPKTDLDMIKCLTISSHFTVDCPLDFDLKTFVKRVLHAKGVRSGWFEFNFIDNACIKQLHQTHLKSNESTDIITFNLGRPDAIIGDIYISVEQAKRNAKRYRQTLSQELKRLMVHGILHLLDYRDYTEHERRDMFKEQERLLQTI